MWKNGQDNKNFLSFFLTVSPGRSGLFATFNAKIEYKSLLDRNKILYIPSQGLM